MLSAGIPRVSIVSVVSHMPSCRTSRFARVGFQLPCRARRVVSQRRVSCVSRISRVSRVSRRGNPPGINLIAKAERSHLARRVRANCRVSRDSRVSPVRAKGRDSHIVPAMSRAHASSSCRVLTEGAIQTCVVSDRGIPGNVIGGPIRCVPVRTNSPVCVCALRCHAFGVPVSVHPCDVSRLNETILLTR